MAQQADGAQFVRAPAFDHHGVKVIVLWGVYTLFRQWALLPSVAAGFACGSLGNAAHSCGLCALHRDTYRTDGTQFIRRSTRVVEPGGGISRDFRRGNLRLRYDVLLPGVVRAPDHGNFSAGSVPMGGPGSGLDSNYLWGRNGGEFQERRQTDSIIFCPAMAWIGPACFHGGAIRLGFVGYPWALAACRGLGHHGWNPEVVFLGDCVGHRVFDGAFGGRERVLDASFLPEPTDPYVSGSFKSIEIPIA